MIYTAEDVLRVAKRFNNKKRNYLLVNPLQGKHLPIKPSVALEMMNTLGQKVAEKFSSARLVVGFAETATAIGAVVAKNLSNECFYIQTTRENYAGEFVEFLEEHSHAPKQKLFAENLNELINQTSEIIFVDDELSTGKTLLNIVRQLKSKFPALNNKKICAASIINRLSEENLAKLTEENISCVYLVKLNQNFDVENISVKPARTIAPINKFIPSCTVNMPVDPILGVKIGYYLMKCEKIGKLVAEIIKNEQINGEILILGTEEFMLPAIIAGRRLEIENFYVVTHSTTRSPIGICDEKNYPIHEGFKLRSFYDATRTTFIYNLKSYDTAIIMTNAENFSVGLDDLVAVLNFHDVNKIFLVEVKNV